MKKKVLLLLPAIFIQNFFLIRWLLNCKSFNGKLYVTSSQITEYLTRDIHNEQGASLLLVRLFFNKVVASAFWGFKAYLTFWDTHFLISLLSVIGVVGLSLGVWYIVTEKKRSKALVFVLVFALLLPLIEVFLHPSSFFAFRLLLLAIPLEIVSLYGIFTAFKSSHSHVLTWVILGSLALSVLFIFTYQTDFYTYCIAH